MMVDKRLTVGYTLIEVIVALAIFAILGMISVGLLSRTFDIKNRVDEALTPLSDLNLALELIRHDAHQIVNRAVYDAEVKQHPAFYSTNHAIEFTRSGYLPLSTPQNPSTLRRVGLICKNNQLVRLSWPVLDRFNAAQPNEQVLLSDISVCHFSFATDKQWTDTWRPSAEKPLPSAFKLHLNLKQLGEAQFIFIIPGGH